MDVRIIGGVALICVIVVVAGVLFYNYDFNPEGADNISTDTTNSDTANENGTDTSTNQLALTILPDNQLRPNPGPYPSPGLTPGPTPGPTPDPMDNVISLFDQYVKSTFLKAHEAGLPGAAVVLVYNGKIVSMNTMGVRDLASGAPVTLNTLFEIGSLTKAFTATLIAQLVDQGLMNWNDTVKKYYPDPNEFFLNDSYIYNHLTIADILMHTSGLPAHTWDIGQFFTNESYSTMLYKMRFVKNNSALGTTHQYNNLMYALGGYSASRVKGIPWSDLIMEELLQPLGMYQATTTVQDYFNTSNHATGYVTFNESGSIIIKPFQEANLDSMGPAGVIGASISEMVNWLKFQTADTGIFNGKQIVSKKNLDETRTGHIYIDPNTGSMYGYGWFTQEAIPGVIESYISHGGMWCL